MKKGAGFTLIEILIALSISSFVMVLIVQNLRQTFKFISEGQKIIMVDRSVVLFLNQLERDFSSAFIPRLPKKEGEEAKKKPEEKKLERTELFFIAKASEEMTTMWFKEKRKMLESLNFVTTYPLQGYGKQKVRRVRVLYELVLNKGLSEGDRQSYDLWRKETTMLDNVDFKEPESMTRQKGKEFIWSYLVAQNVKEFSCEFIAEIEEEEPREKKQEKKKKVLKSFSWGESEETQNLLPDFMRYHLVFWDGAKGREYPFDGILPTFSEMKKEKEEEPHSAHPSKPGAPKPATAPATVPTPGPHSVPQQAGASR